MAEYIERSIAKDELLSWAVCIKHPEHLMKEDAMCVLDNIPAADVAPVVHGRWVAKPQMYRHPNARNYYCSECRYEPTETKMFCPLCGARMDGE